MDLSLRVGMADFKAVYDGSRCLLQHADPYNESEFERVYSADGGDFPTEPAMLLRFRRAVLVSINLPTSLLLIAPLAMLGWGPAHALWLLFLAVSLIAAGFLMWDVGASYAPGLSLFRSAWRLPTAKSSLSAAIPAGIAIGLCAVAVWCFLKRLSSWLAFLHGRQPRDQAPRYGPGLAVFLLAGGVTGSALQTLVVTAMLCLPAIIFGLDGRAALDTGTEIQSGGDFGARRSQRSRTGFDRLPQREYGRGPSIGDQHHPGRSPHLQSSHLADVRSAVAGGRASHSQVAMFFGPSLDCDRCSRAPYHARDLSSPYDAKLLLLGVPACAMLWAEGGRIGRLALLANAAGIVLTGDIPSAILIILARHFQINPVGFSGKLLTILVMRPAPLALLAMGIFYLWVYMRHVPGEAAPAEQTGPGKTPIALAQS